MRSCLYVIKLKVPFFDFLKIFICNSKINIWLALTSRLLFKRKCYKMNVAIIEAENVSESVFPLVKTL